MSRTNISKRAATSVARKSNRVPSKPMPSKIGLGPNGQQIEWVEITPKPLMNAIRHALGRTQLATVTIPVNFVRPTAQ